MFPPEHFGAGTFEVGLVRCALLSEDPEKHDRKERRPWINGDRLSAVGGLMSRGLLYGMLTKT